MPAACFDGVWLHERVSDQAAAYRFHIVRNHPFVDGSKRTGLIAAIAFLGLNGQSVTADADELAARVEGVAAGAIGKTAVATFLADHLDPRRKR